MGNQQNIPEAYLALCNVFSVRVACVSGTMLRASERHEYTLWTESDGRIVRQVTITGIKTKTWKDAVRTLLCDKPQSLW